MSTNQSSTFQENGVVPTAVTVPFARGSIKAFATTGVVRAGSLSATVKDGLFLMVERYSVNLSQAFEGVLGLGPRRAGSPIALNTNWTSNGSKQDSSGSLSSGSAANESSSYRRADSFAGGFLEAANIDTFSVCFRNGDKPGILRLGTQLGSNEMVSMGQRHWGLGLSGISIGDAHEQPILCNAWQAQGQRPGSACSAVPDTGATAITAPRSHLSKLFESICNQWPRCVRYSQRIEGLALQMAAKGFDQHKFAAESNNISGATMQPPLILLEVSDASKLQADTNPIPNPSDTGPSSSMLKSSALLSLLDDCASWMNETNGAGLSEMPNINLQLKGDGNEPQTISLSGWSYVYEVMEPDAAQVRSPMRELFPSTLLHRSVREDRRVCTPAFGELETVSRASGPLWILGQPIFMQYQVGFSRSQPLKMSFTPIKSCIACSSESEVAPSLLQVQEEKGNMNILRRMQGPLRLTSIDPRGLSEFL
jgi:hypothetical protein